MPPNQDRLQCSIPGTKQTISRCPGLMRVRTIVIQVHRAIPIHMANNSLSSNRQTLLRTNFICGRHIRNLSVSNS